MGSRAMTVGVCAPLLGACSLLLGEGYDSGRADAVDGAPPASDAAPNDAIVATNDAASDADAPSVCPPGASDPTLVAWYPFEETSNDTILDCSGHGHDGKWNLGGTFTRVNGATATSGRAIDLDGVRGCFDLGPASDLDFGSASFTVAAWVRPRSYSFPAPDGGTNPKPRTIIGRFDLGVGWGMGTDDPFSVEMKAFDSPSTYFEAQATITANTWVHVAGVFTASQLDLYVGGAKAATHTSTAPGAAAAAHALLGCRDDTFVPYDGSVDDVRVYARALSAGEIAALAN